MPSTVDADTPTRKKRGVNLRRALAHPGRWLALVIAAYIAFSFTLSYLRVIELSVSNWDLGIFQQALWSTNHGYLLYESGDWEGNGVASFLQIHPAPILFALVPIYAVAPSPLTLLAVQSAVVGLAAVPLYWIGVRVLRRSWAALGLAGLYLAFAPVLSSNLYDFHMEAFLPLELFLLFYLWLTDRYFLAFVPAVAAFTTLEVGPFLVAAVAVYFLTAPSDPATTPPLRSPGPTPPPAPAGARVRAWWAQRGVRWSMLLLLSCLIAYAVLREFEWQILPNDIGLPAPVASGFLSQSTIANSSGVTINLAFRTQLGLKLGYWLTLLALLAFLPLLAPRELLLTAPWFAFTLQSNQGVWVHFGYQYGFIAVTGIMIGAVFGLRNVYGYLLPWTRARAVPRLPASVQHRWRTWPEGRRRGVVAAGAVGMLGVLVLTNLALTPANPSEQNPNSASPAYHVSYHVVPGYLNAVATAALIPGGAWVLSSDDLFPLVADNDHAYCLLWIPAPPQYLPFSNSSLPQFVFLSTSQDFAVPLWLWPNLANESTYGLYGVVVTSPVGQIDLYELGYTGPTLFPGPQPPGGTGPIFRG